MRRAGASVVVVALLMLVGTAPAAALEIRGASLRSAATVVRAGFELADVIAGPFKKLLEQGGVVHLRVQAEVWERRPAWDVLVYPAAVRVVRLTRSRTSASILMVDDEGSTSTHDAAAGTLPLDIALGQADRIRDDARYYVRVMATVGTIAERDPENYSDAIFGRPGEANGLGALGREVVRRMLQLTDYLQSESAEARSRVIPGARLLNR